MQTLWYYLSSDFIFVNFEKKLNRYCSSVVDANLKEIIYIHNGKYIFKFNKDAKKTPTLYMPLPARIQMHLFVTLHIFTLLADLETCFLNRFNWLLKYRNLCFRRGL